MSSNRQQIAIRALVAIAVVAAALALWMLPRAQAPAVSPVLVLLLPLLAGVAGAFPVRLPGLRTELTPTHPIVFCALAGVGGTVAVAAAMVGVLGAFLRRRTRPIQLVFNLAAVTLATCAAFLVFLAAGGWPGDSTHPVLGPLGAATLVYFLVNTGLVTSVISIHRRDRPWQVWQQTFQWTAASFFTGLTVAIGLLLLLDSQGPWGLALAVPPCWLIAVAYRASRDRIVEKQRRIEEVEQLNLRLSDKVEELRDALAHVKQLQGLLPICMHCKSVRDDEDTWHRLEAYLSSHSDAQITHSLCDHCRDEHYAQYR